MDFLEISKKRYSCRDYDPDKNVEDAKLDLILETARLAPSACNGQPYHVTVCKNEKAKEVARATQSMGMNSFASNAPVMLVISEMPYVKTAAIGAKLKGNDYRSIDIGILAAYITAEAYELGVASCILGWLDDKRIRDICGIDGTVRLVICLGYEKSRDEVKDKKRKTAQALFKVIQ